MGRGEKESVEEFIMRVECISARCLASAEFVSSREWGLWKAGGREWMRQGSVNLAFWIADLAGVVTFYNDQIW